MVLSATAFLAGALVESGSAEMKLDPPLPTPALIESAVRSDQIDRHRGNLLLAYALGPKWHLVPEGYRSDVPWDGTTWLLLLDDRIDAMNRGPRRSALVEAMHPPGTGMCGTVSAGPGETDSTHFHIHHSAISGGLLIDHYKTSLDTAWDKEVNTFGWAAPPLPLGFTKYPVVVAGLIPGLYGFVRSTGVVGDNMNTPSWNEGDAETSCMVLNSDYSWSGSPQASLDGTTAHEFNHSIQFGYGALQGANMPDRVFIEGGATWMEDEVFDTSDDNHNFLWPVFEDSMGEYNANPYEYWIVFRSLAERYGTGSPGGAEQVMQDFWEETSRNTGSNLTALQTALANKGTSLADAFHAYAIAAKFNKPCGGGYVYPHCLEEAAAYVAASGPTTVHGAISIVGGSLGGSVEDNYALNWVQLPTGSAPYPVKLMNTSGGGQLRGSVVCDTGSSFTVTPLPAAVAAGFVTTLTALDPSGCASVVAVITNQSQTHANPSSSAPRSYLLATDVTPPAAPAVGGSTLSKPFQTTPKFDLSWGVAEAVRYDVRYRSAPYGADFGGFVAWQSGTAGTSAVFNGSPGRSYCFSARATDADLNTSDYGAERCTAIPAANTALKHRGHWAKRKGSGYFLGAFSVTSTQGANLVLANVRAKRLAIVVTKCRGCGTIKVFLRNKLLRTIRLRAGSNRKRQIVNLAIFNSVRRGTLHVRVTSSGRPVKIEGVGVSAS